MRGKEREMKRILWSILITVVLLAAGQGTALARGSSAINGAEGWFAGALPPPGWHYLNYVLYYTADDLLDGDGNSAIPGFDATIWAEVIRPLYVSDYQLWGGNYAWHAVIPIVSKEISAVGVDESDTGIADIYVSAGVIAWHPREDLHYAAGLDFILPTGSFDANAPPGTSIGNDHWTIEPAFAVTKTYANGWQADAKLMLDFHTESDEIKYKTGTQFHMDYNVGRAINEKMRLGVGGYIIKSLEEDELDGVAQAGSEEQALAIGPSLMYHCSPRTSLVLKVLFETSVEGRPEGTATWFRVIHSF